MAVAKRKRAKAKGPPALGRLDVQTVAVADLIPWADNPREIDDAALAGLGASIDQFGLVDPIIWNRRTGHVVHGHQRLAVITDRGVTQTDVVVVDLPEIEEQALAVELNNPEVQGRFTDGLAEIIKRIGEAQPGLPEPLRLDKLLRQMRPTFDPVGPEEQGRLDRRSPVKCPECGHEFVP